jgi:O-acetyl-ADP-ribose deacetylase (regulator of RNase III)
LRICIGANLEKTMVLSQPYCLAGKLERDDGPARRAQGGVESGVSRRFFFKWAIGGMGDRGRTGSERRRVELCPLLGSGREHARPVMSKPSWTERIQVVEGDITQQAVDAIVNAANSTLLGGGGVDGAIHRAAGPELLAECRTLGGCPTGQAKITKGYRLRAKFVTHTVGPVWYGGDRGEDELLASCYRNSLALAAQHNVRTIAFPSISTGAYGFPMDRAARIAVAEIRGFLERQASVEKVLLICFGQAALGAYQQALRMID